jgi:hypothetical protein
VPRVDAPLIPANVINNHPFAHRSDEVGVKHFVSWKAVVADTEVRVPRIAFIRPYPAPIDFGYNIAAQYVTDDPAK